MRTPHVLTLAAAAVAFSVVAPAHADAPPDGLAALHLTKRAPKLVADAFTFERTEDQRAFFGKVSPEWIVHTAVDAAAGARVCPSTWNVRACVSLDPKDTKQRVSREQLARKDWFAFPKYGWAMGWGTTLTYGDDVARGKPHPDPYLTAAAHLGLDPHDCIAIEDSTLGARSADAAGCCTIVVPHAVAVAPEHGHHRLASLDGVSVADLAGLLSSCPRTPLGA